MPLSTLSVGHIERTCINPNAERIAEALHLHAHSRKKNKWHYVDGSTHRQQPSAYVMKARADTTSELTFCLDNKFCRQSMYFASDHPIEVLTNKSMIR